MFKRLTKLKGNYVCWNGNQDYSTRDRYAKVLDRLAAYEDTRLTPERIRELQNAFNILFESERQKQQENERYKTVLKQAREALGQASYTEELIPQWQYKNIVYSAIQAIDELEGSE